MNEPSPHQKFLLLVQTCSIVKDIQNHKQIAQRCVAEVFNVSLSSFMDAEKDVDRITSMAEEYVNWFYEEGDRPKWISFFDGKFS